jgi:hypothetical protein
VSEIAGRICNELATCISCGCDDLHACGAGCYWVRVDRGAGIGVCSECQRHVTRYDAGNRKLSVQARLEVDLRKEFGG